MLYFVNEQIFYKEYLNCFSQSNPAYQIMQLIQKFEYHYKVRFNFDNNYLYFPLYRNSGSYSDLTF